MWKIKWKIWKIRKMYRKIRQTIRKIRWTLLHLVRLLKMWEDVEKTGAFSTSDVEESEEVEENPETYQETVVLDAPAVDYVQQLDNIASLLLFDLLPWHWLRG